jgi:hypothetical protein
VPITPGRTAVYGFGALGIAAFVFKMLAVDYPEGDPAKARLAAAVWRRLGDRIEASQDRTFPSAESVWKRNAGEGIETYKLAVTKGLYPNPPEKGYAEKLAQRCRDNAAACEAFAEIIETARHAYWTLAIANFASFIFITTFPWQAKTAYEIAQFFVRQAEAKVLQKLLRHSLAKLVLGKLLEYSIGSAFFAVGDVAAVAGVKWARGEDPGSWSDNGKQAFKEFTASVAFYGVYDAAAPVTRLMTKNPDVQAFINRMAGGNFGYGPTYDSMSGEGGSDLVPTWKQVLGRSLLYFTMAHKPMG